MHCHKKFIRGYLKSKYLNDTNELSVTELKKGFAEMPQQSKITDKLSLIQKHQNKSPAWNAMGTEGVLYEFRLNLKHFN